MRDAEDADGSGAVVEQTPPPPARERLAAVLDKRPSSRPPPSPEQDRIDRNREFWMRPPPVLLTEAQRAVAIEEFAGFVSAGCSRHRFGTLILIARYKAIRQAQLQNGVT